MIAPLVLAAVLTTGVAAPVPAAQPEPCKNVLVTALHDAGFRGENLKEAWAIAMRESGGRPDAISSTGDYGVFQFNRAAHGRQDWWDTDRLLTREYNIKVAYRMSKGGKWWGPWDMSGSGEHLGRYTPASVGQKFDYWYDRFPERCERLAGER